MYQQWVQMENFYFTSFPLLLGGMIILAIIFLIFISHIQKRIPRIMVTGSLALGLLLGWYTYSQYQRYLPYINQLQYVDASTRNYEKKILADYGYSVNEKKSYRSYYNKDIMEQFILYEPVQLKEEIEFLGSLGDRYGIKIGRHLYNISKRSINFVDNLNHAQRIGVEYQLKEPEFETIGFVKTTQPLLIEFQVPTREKDKQVSGYNDTDFTVDFEVVEEWILP